jgi:hypothetical protein
VGEVVIVVTVVGSDQHADGRVAFAGWERLTVIADLLRKDLAAPCQIAQR